MLTVFGSAAVSLMVVAYALEQYHPALTLTFAAGCVCSSIYGFLLESLPFGIRGCRRAVNVSSAPGRHFRRACT
jgi:hypothetical protein